MALTTTPQPTPLAAVLAVQTSATAAPDLNITGASGSWFMVDIDNTANAAVTYVKIYDDAAPTVGTTEPDWVLRADATKRVVYAVSTSVAFAAMSFAAVTTPGRAGTTSPVSAVPVRVMAT
jgi:hypothetical protein